MGKEPVVSASGWGAHLGHTDDVLGLPGVCGDSEHPTWYHVRCGDFCRRALVSRPLGRHGTGSIWWGGGRVLLSPHIPKFLPWEESGQGYRSETQGSVPSLCSPLPLSSTPSLCGKPSSAHHMCRLRQPRGGTGTRVISVLSTSLRLHGYHLNLSISHWTVVTVSPLASPLLLPSNPISRQQPEG